MLKSINIKFSTWSEVIEKTVIIPDDILWVKDYSVTNSALKQGFCNYWTVMNEDAYKQFKELNPSIHYRKYKLVDKYIICIDNVEPSNSIKTTIHEQDLLSPLDLDNIIIIAFDEYYNVANISKIRYFFHPYYTNLNTICFYRYNNEDLVSTIQSNSPLITETDRSSRYKYIVMKDDKHIWDAALNYVYSKLDKNVEYVYHYTWRHNIIPPDIKIYTIEDICKINETKSTEFKIPFEYILWEESSTKLLNQFGLKKSDLV